MEDCVYTADLHGNTGQYLKLIDICKQINPKFVFIGGDLLPGGLLGESKVLEQRVFLLNVLPKVFKTIRQVKSKPTIFFITGNEDYKTNIGLFDGLESELCFIVNNRRLNLSKELDIVGYPYVPVTPFVNKDWEKWDLSEIPCSLNDEYKSRIERNYRLSGFRSNDNELNPFCFSQDFTDDSIQKDLSSPLFKQDSYKTIYLFHAPPNHTCLDLLPEIGHVGSFAIRTFIEDYQPYLTLHGHVHETVDSSGRFMQKIKKTICISSGNISTSNYLNVIVFDLNLPTGATLHKIL